jgi:hypothetical protein
MEKQVHREAKLKLEAVEPSELTQVEGGWLFLIVCFAAGVGYGALGHDLKYGTEVPTSLVSGAAVLKKYVK